jgi:hypothetical protein
MMPRGKALKWASSLDVNAVYGGCVLEELFDSGHSLALSFANEGTRDIQFLC